MKRETTLQPASRAPLLLQPLKPSKPRLSLLALAAQAALLGVVCGTAVAPQPAWAQAADASDQARSDVVMPTVKAAISRESSDLPKPYAGGQVAKGGRLGALGNQEVLDTPFNVTSYTAQVIEDQQARTLADVLLNDPSVRFTTSSGHAYENFRIRGFDVNQNDVAIDGMFGLVPMGHTPVEFVERVEVLKGPNALFSGMAPSGAIGGVVNLVPKRAGDDPLSRVSVGVQSDSQLITSVDLGRRFGQDKTWGLRVNGALGNGDTTLEGQSKRREFLSAALDYRDGALKATLDAYTSQESFKGGTPAMFWFASTAIPTAPDPAINQFPGASGDLDSKGVMARVEYQINPRLAAFAGVGAMSHDYSGFINGSHVRSINALGTSTATLTVGQRGYNDNLSAEAGLRADFRTGAVLHEAVLQASWLDQESGSDSTRSAAFTTNIYNPVYRAMPALPATAPKTSDNTLSSLALVDTMSLMSDRLRLTLGLRHQTVKTTNYVAATGAVSGTPYDKSALTPALAAVIKPWGPSIALYANYVQGLSKGDSVTRTSGYVQDYTFAPYKTEQKEVGVKWDAGSFAHTASLFEITRPMLIRLAGPTPTTATASDDGEKRVRGLEWNTFGEIARNVRLLGGVVWTDGVQTRTENNLYNGKTAVGAPRWQGNLGVEWDTPWAPGLTLSARTVASSSQYMDSANTQQIPGWSAFDVGARYATQLASRKVVFRLGVANLFDRHYYSGAFSETTPVATLGQGRTVTASATVDF